MIQTLLKGLRGTDWEMLTDFVSPVFFEVVPTLGMASVFASIAKDYANKSEFIRVKESTQSAFKSSASTRLNSEIKIFDHLENGAVDLDSLTADEKKRRGDLILQVYFSQLLACQSTILDIRSNAFGKDGAWAPKSVYYRWNKDFRTGICDLYRGFYQDNKVLFDSGLKQLNLAHASDIFRAHFGEGDQDSVTFTLQHFKKSFHAIFLSCKENRAKLHPDFFALGVYLVCLYEHLEKLNIPLNVRSAFAEATKA